MVADASERADQVPGFDRPSGAGREDEPGANPGPAEVQAVRVLVLLADDERVLGQAEQRQVPVTGLGLDRPDVELALRPVNLLPDTRIIRLPQSTSCQRCLGLLCGLSADRPGPAGPGWDGS